MLAFAATATTTTFAAEIFVNGASGSDANDGKTPAHALATIQSAEKIARAGDTITVARGVYYGPVELKQLRGTEKNPVTLRAESRERGAVVITNADPALRERRAAWECVDEALQLYRAPLARETCRVLYSGVDLQPCLTLDGLKTFTVGKKLPGPAHGYFYDADARQIYVRLRADGKYGSQNPNQHRIAAGTRTGAGSAGTGFDGPHFYNLGLMQRGKIHVIVDGFTFETPGFSGVHINGSHVTVRDCWFLGCRTGVSGRKENADPRQTSNAITVEFCDYSQFPAFDDAMDVLRERTPPAGAPRYPLYSWSRKGDGATNRLTYELGIIGLVGSDWTLRNNRIHDSFEGISTWCVRWSQNLAVRENIFERIVDNAVELEDHAAGMRVERNVFLDTTEPFSWQPLGGEPWPGPALIADNFIRSSEVLTRLVFEKTGHRPGWFKAGAANQNWTATWNAERMKNVSQDAVRAPGAGIVVENNTVIFPSGNFLTLTQPRTRVFENFHFAKNIVVAEGFGGGREAGHKDYTAAKTEFRENVWFYGSAKTGLTGGDVFAGEDGVVLPLPPPPSPLALEKLSTATPGDFSGHADIAKKQAGARAFTPPRAGPRINNH
ncbi:MAG: right-handed parallel beta-helix repeat-containing protein [Opitutaceae bacterium]|jgi:hypothetical protein|nr:right-handed parallel beta-helix repeat-containing protein [Opitutaceae bacterium]